jgi:hypothetical protein
MKTITILIPLLLASATLALSDGIPVDRKTGKVRCAHTVVSLTAEQVEETQALGTFTLTSEQWRALRAKRPSCPKRFNTVLPVTFNDCCCGVEGEYVIALSRDRIAVLMVEDSDEALRSVRWAIFRSQAVTLRANERGKFYAGGMLVPFPLLLKAFATPPEGGKRDAQGKILITEYLFGRNETGTAWLVVELPMGAKPTDAVYESRLRQIAALADKIGLSHMLFPEDERKPTP